jgi:hypothetical protein
MECIWAVDLPSESRLRATAAGLGERSVSCVLTQGEGVHHPWSRVLENVHFVQSELTVTDAAKKSPGCITPAVRESRPATARRTPLHPRRCQEGDWHVATPGQRVAVQAKERARVKSARMWTSVLSGRTNWMRAFVQGGGHRSVQF